MADRGDRHPAAGPASSATWRTHAPAASTVAAQLMDLAVVSTPATRPADIVTPIDGLGLEHLDPVLPAGGQVGLHEAHRLLDIDVLGAPDGQVIG